tara:strand:- start:339 stop:1460 length:1122 start_codon:yes stop_codon:yes gene_type:complete
MHFYQKKYKNTKRILNMTITFRDISHRFGNEIALANIDLEVADGEIVCILGPSGSGKSTLLRIAAGLEPLQSGVIYLDDKILADPHNNPPPEKRSIGLVFQDHVLFPHQTVAENIAFGLNKLNKADSTKIVEQQLKNVDMFELANRYPHTLSGGQQQRVALTRALATKPSVMLLDEPFASADTPLRRKLREQARATLKNAGTPTLVVTHDPEEAMDMADRILVLVNGRAVQLGAPESLWRTPQSPFVAQTFAGMQSVTGTVVGGHVKTVFGKILLKRLESIKQQSGQLAFEPLSSIKEGLTVTISLRASSLSLEESNGPAMISDQRFLGRGYLTIVTLKDEKIRIESDQPQDLSIGTLVDINFASAVGLIYSG